MTPHVLASVLVAVGGASLLLSLVASRLAIPAARRLGYVDRPGAHKSHVKVTPYGGGVAIFVAAWLPLLLILLAAMFVSEGWVARHLSETLAPYWGGVLQRRAPMAAIVLGGVILHLLGLYDDLRPLGPAPKLLVMVIVATLAATFGEARLAEAVGGPASIVLSVAWLLVIMNSMNFLDNMDGLSAGIAAISLAFIVVCGLLAGQVLVPLLGCLFLGAILGFLAFNFPPAKLFMGDAGSLLVGYMLGVMSIMTTYYESGGSAPPYALAMPLVILAVPLYDFVLVMAIRIAEGRHPMQGDQRHFSHRLVDRGLSRRNAVLTIYIVTAATGLSATLLPGADLRETVTILSCVLMLLAIIAILEAPLRKQS